MASTRNIIERGIYGIQKHEAVEWTRVAELLTRASIFAT